MRALHRKPTEIRPVEFDLSVLPHAEGACLIKLGQTHVLCTASVEEKVPPFLRNTGSGWITAEYGMLPRATNTRTDREAVKGKQSGRTHEIQRLIGRSLRSVVDLKSLGERQIKIDCDVIQADGGTRTASITGAYIALHRALQGMVDKKKIQSLPVCDFIAAISCGIHEGEILLDLDYAEDSTAHADANFVMTGRGQLIEVQATAEKNTFSPEQFLEMLNMARLGIQSLISHQQSLLLPSLQEKFGR